MSRSAVKKKPNFPAVVASRLATLKLTPRDLAQRTELSKGMISLLLSGKRGPSLATLRIMSDVLDVPLAELVEAAGRK
jgi:transcriptional regulator with XRE-family HTH domain